MTERDLELVVVDYDAVLKAAHLRWINERTPEAADAFDRALLAAIKAARDLACRTDGEQGSETKE